VTAPEQVPVLAMVTAMVKVQGMVTVTVTVTVTAKAVVPVTIDRSSNTKISGLLMALERRIQAYVLRELREAGAVCTKVESNVLGWPDLLVVYKGRTILVELKRPEGVLSEDQERVHARIRSEGGEVFVWRSLQQCRAWIATLQSVDSSSPA